VVKIVRGSLLLALGVCVMLLWSDVGSE